MRMSLALLLTLKAELCHDVLLYNLVSLISVYRMKKLGGLSDARPELRVRPRPFAMVDVHISKLWF